jgi:hypothetical protein
MAFDLFRRRQVPGNWSRDTLLSSPTWPNLATTPNKAIDYLKDAADLARTTDVSVSKSTVKVSKIFPF